MSRHSKQIAIKIKTVQQIKPRIWEMKGGKYTDPRQDSGQRNISYTRYPKKCFTQTYRDLYGDAMLVLIWMSSNMADVNQQKHLLPSFATKSVNLFFEKLTNIKVILFLIRELFRQQNFLICLFFFNLHDSSLGRPSVNAASRKSLKIQAYQLYHKTKNFFWSKLLYENQFSAALMHRESKILVGSIVFYFEFQ